MRRGVLIGAGVAVVVATTATPATAVSTPAPAVSHAAGAVSHAAPGVAVTLRPAAPSRRPPTLTVLSTARNGPSRGYIFSGPKYDVGGPAHPRIGVLITDNRGRAVYYNDVGHRNLRATDVRRQRYRGQPVLTYWLGGTQQGAVGVGAGLGIIMNDHYRVIAAVRSHTQEPMDLHEFTLTAHNTALIVSYDRIRADATAMGGAKNQVVLDCVVQEINLRTHRLVFSWHSARHVPLTASHIRAPSKASVPYDYFHLNSIKYDTDGNLIVSSRHTWTVYKINRRTGAIMWQLGGKHSSFRLGAGVRFAWQHDAEPVGHNEYRIFDNASDGEPGGAVAQRSRVEWVQVDPAAHTARLVRAIAHPGPPLLVGSQGNSEALAHGATFVDYGAVNRMSEYTANGTMVFDAKFTQGQNTYRAYLAPWFGQPTTPPQLVRRGSHFDAIWNGASTVARWRVLGGPGPGDLHRIGALKWTGLDTGFRLSRLPRFVQVVAVDAHGRILRRSAVLRTG